MQDFDKPNDKTGVYRYSSKPRNKFAIQHKINALQKEVNTIRKSQNTYRAEYSLGNELIGPAIHDLEKKDKQLNEVKKHLKTKIESLKEEWQTLDNKRNNQKASLINFLPLPVVQEESFTNTGKSPMKKQGKKINNDNGIEMVNLNSPLNNKGSDLNR